MVKILVPIAGEALIDSETQFLKGLREVNRKMILQHVVDSLSQIPDANFIFVIRKDDVSKFHMDNIVKLMVPNADIVIAESNTAGSACTCLLAIGKLSPDEPLIVSGSDQLVAYDLKLIVDSFKTYDAGVIVFDDIHPRWSYVKMDEKNCVIEAAEKNPISRNATTGFFYFRKSSDFIEAVMSMIRKGASVNGSYYVCPALNELVLKNKRIGVFKIPRKNYFNFNNKVGVESYDAFLNNKG